MQNAQNNFTVENLVAKYRNYVAEKCPKICEFDGVSEFLRPIDNEADEQLLVTLYAEVAGFNSDLQILEALSKYRKEFRKEALSEEEFVYLRDNFSAVVSYEFAHRQEWLNIWRHTHKPISEGRIRLVKEYVKPQVGAKIFIADTEYCDLAVLFPDCIISGFTGYNYMQKEVWALGQIRLYAAGIQSEIVSGEEVNDNNGEYSYTLPDMGSIDVVIFRVNESKYFAQRILGTECSDIEALYDLLKPDGKMLFFSEFITEMAGKKADKYEEPVFDFRIRRVKEKAISSIVSYEDKGPFGNKYVMLALCKAENSEVCIIDETKSRTKYINAEEIDPEMLWPSYYWAVQPTEGIPFSSIVKIADVELHEEEKLAEFVKGEGWHLLEKAKDMPLIMPTLLGDSYKDANLLHKAVGKVGDPAFEEDCMMFGIAKEPFVLLSGNSENLKVGYTTKVPDEGFAYMKGCCMVPLDGIDVRYIAALLFEPSIKEQILTICDGRFSNRLMSLVLDKIIVPNHSDNERLSFMAEVNYEALLSSQEQLTREHENYTKAVRMRKHALTQSLSSIEAMFYALNEYRIRQNGNLSDKSVISRVQGTTVKEAFEFLSIEIKNMMPVLEHIADVEYTFSKPESIDPEEFIENYIEKEEKGWLNFKPVVSWEKGNNKAKQDIKNEEGLVVFEEGRSINTFFFPKDALEKIFDNILSNAKAYAFTDDLRKDYQLKFSWYVDGTSLVINVENNGTPIPEDRDTATLLEYGVSTALHKDGHNGIGCNEIKDIITRYDGKVEIVSTPTEDYTVKYVLTFNNANVFRLL